MSDPRMRQPSVDSWRDAIPAIQGLSNASVALRGGRYKEGLTQKQLAQATGIPQAHISRMENGKLAIGKERAKRLGQAQILAP